MMKLWEKSAIAKIAIKRGVQNTCNERMAEELKVRHNVHLLLEYQDDCIFSYTTIHLECTFHALFPAFGGC